MKRTPTLPPSSETDEKIRTASQSGHLQYSQQTDKGSPLVVFVILAGDIITVAFVMLWLFRWR
jgi:hypothetical protein